MSRRTDAPHVRVFQGDTMSVFPATAYESLTHALQFGDVWWEGTTLYGAATLIRCASITDVTLMTADSISAVAEDNDQPEWVQA